MPLLAFALTYGSFGDIKETFAMVWRLYKILRDRRGSSDEIQKVLEVLECHRADIATLISLLQTDSPPDAQQFVNNISAELDWCHSHMAKLCAGIAPSKALFAYLWSAFSVERALASWRAQMAHHRAVLSGQLQLLLVALSIDGQQQLQRMAFQIQYVGAEVEQIVRETGSLIMATTARQISDAESNIMQRLTQGMNLHHVSVAIFSVTDPLGRPIPISLAHCGDFEALDRILKAYIFNRPEAGARYVERGDYNLFLPEGTIVRRVDFARTVKSGTQLDMSIIKRPRFRHAPEVEKCPYCNEENPRIIGNEWTHCSNRQCGRRYQISVKLADEIEAIEEIYSPQLLTKGDETRTQEQEKEDTDLFRLVEIQATYDTPAFPAPVSRGTRSTMDEDEFIFQLGQYLDSASPEAVTEQDPFQNPFPVSNSDLPTSPPHDLTGRSRSFGQQSSIPPEELSVPRGGRRRSDITSFPSIHFHAATYDTSAVADDDSPSSDLPPMGPHPRPMDTQWIIRDSAQQLSPLSPSPGLSDALSIGSV